MPLELVQFEMSHLPLIAARLQPVLQKRLESLADFETAIRRAEKGVTAKHGDRVLGAAWFFRLPDGTFAAVALSTEDIKTHRTEFLRESPKWAKRLQKELGARKILAHVHESFPASERWLRKMGFKFAGNAKDGLKEYVRCSA